MPKKEQKPQIRFKGFTDDWEQRKVSELAERYDNLRVPVAANLRVPGNTPYYGANGIQDYVTGYTHDGEYILVAEDGANDLKNYPVNYVNGRIWVNNHAHVLQGKKKISSNRFLSYAISLVDIESVLVGGGRAKLNAEVMMNLDVKLPSYGEQTKIGAFFSKLDNLITLHQRKYEKLKNIKKSMLEKMFPKNENKIPEIRFKGFTDDWEQRKLDDIADDIADGPFGSNLKAEHYTEEKEARIVQLSNIGETGWHDENVKYTTFTHAREISRSIVTPNSLIMAKMMPAGMTIICPNADKMYVLSSDAVKIKLKNNINATYFVSMTKSKEFLQQIDCDAQGSTRTRTSISKIRKMNVPVPELSEQTKIGAFFSKLDNLITLHQRKYEKLKNIKKSMLEKMFV